MKYERRNFTPPEGFAPRLREIILQRGYSLRTLGDLSGVNYETIRHTMYGDTNPNITILAKPCRALGCSADYLLFGDR